MGTKDKALALLRKLGYKVHLERLGKKTKIKTQFVGLSKAFRRKAHTIKAHPVKATSNALRIHGYWRKPKP